MSNIEEKVIEIISRNLGADTATVTRDTDIAKDLGADSLDIAELVMALEDEFDIEIPETEAQNIVTIGQAIDYIQTAAGNK